MLIDCILVPVEAFQTDDAAAMGFGVAGQDLAHAGPGHVRAVVGHERECGFWLVGRWRQGGAGPVAETELGGCFDEGEV